jgi:hypothetical protein
MNGEQIRTLCETIAQQVGIPADSLSKALPFWQPNLIQIESERAMEGLKVMLVNGTQSGKDPGKWLAAVIRYAGSNSTQAVQHNGVSSFKEPDGCENCNHSGAIEVPHDKDWKDGRWHGMYTMVVACECGQGQMRACQMVNIRQYEHKYPYWRNEYPIRKYEREYRDVINKPVPRDKEDAIRHQSRIAFLKKQLGEVEQS